MQTNSNFADKIRFTAAADVASGELVAHGDIIGAAYEAIAAGDSGILLTRGQFDTTEVVTAETWTAGQRVYYDVVNDRFTTRRTDWPAGRAAAAKADTSSFGQIQITEAIRSDEEIIYTVDAAKLASGATVASRTLRDFGAESVQITHAEIVADGMTPNTSTISIGDGSGSNNQIFPATALNATPFSAGAGYAAWDYDTADPPGSGEVLPVTVTKVVLGIAGAAFTAGSLRVRLRFQRIA
jgi:predicted RecA/RadA family phage recombinase